jgi:hypothetical protein
MGLFARRKAGAQNPPGPEPVWLPGNVEVQIVGETFYIAEIKAATRRVPPGSRLPAVLIAEPDNPHDENAVGVYLNGHRAGHLAREIAPAVQAALSGFVSANGGRPPACPAEVIWHDAGPQMILYLDPAPLGLPASLFDWVPDSARVIRRNLSMLDRPAAQLTGLDPAARSMLAAAEEHRAHVDADYGRGADAWPVAERAFVAAARQLQASGDPLVADAWVGVARSVRYLKRRRDDRITAACTALYWDRASKDAWAELVDAASAAPHVPTLRELFQRVPVDARPPVLTMLISLSRGHDRLGNMHPEAGQRLRESLRVMAEADGDKASITKLARDARKHAEVE